MAEFTKFDEAQVSGQPPISEELMTLLTAATVHKSILDGFRALAVATCGRFSSLADDRFLKCSTSTRNTVRFTCFQKEVPFGPLPWRTGFPVPGRGDPF